MLRGYTLLEAPYEFGTDNLMDLSHIEFVHTGSLAGDGVIFAGTHKVIDEGGTRARRKIEAMLKAEGT